MRPAARHRHNPAARRRNERNSRCSSGQIRSIWLLTVGGRQMSYKTYFF